MEEKSPFIKLPENVLSTLSINSEDSEDSEDSMCKICYDDYKYPIILPCCNKKYCFNCISEYKKISSKCPLCRRNLESKVNDNFYIPINPFHDNLENFNAINQQHIENGVENDIENDNENDIDEDKYDENIKTCLYLSFSSLIIGIIFSFTTQVFIHNNTNNTNHY